MDLSLRIASSTGDHFRLPSRASSKGDLLLPSPASATGDIFLGAEAASAIGGACL